MPPELAGDAGSTSSRHASSCLNQAIRCASLSSCRLDALLARGWLCTFLVSPVRRQPQLGGFVHLLRANLDLERAPVLVGDHRMQRLITVQLWPRNVVVVVTGDRGPLLVDRRQRLIAIRHAFDDHAQATHIA